jgi:hypothetical protein
MHAAGLDILMQKNEPRHFSRIESQKSREKPPIDEIGIKDSAYLFGQIEHIETEHHAAHTLQRFVDKRKDNLNQKHDAVENDGRRTGQNENNDGKAQNEREIYSPKGGDHPHAHGTERNNFYQNCRSGI